MKALALSLMVAAIAGCGVSTATSRVGFATADGASTSNAPFSLLRFTPATRDQMIAGTSVKRHPSGDVIVGGIFSGVADVGVGPDGLPGRTAFVGRYSPAGRPRWVRWMSIDDNQGPRVAVDEGGDVIVLARSRFAPRAFGEPEPKACEPPECEFAAHVHSFSADGGWRWSRSLAQKDPREAMSAELVATDAKGDVTVAGRFGNQNDLFVSRYAAASGARQWFTRIRSSLASGATGLTVVPDGDVVLTGETTGVLKVEDAVIGTTGASGFALRLATSDGGTKWMKRLGDPNMASSGLAAASANGGDVFVVARVRDPNRPSDQALIERLAGDTGAPRWSRAIAKRDGQIRGAAIDVEDGTTPIIAFQTTRASQQNAAVVVAVSGDSGTPLWSRDLRTYAEADVPWTVEASSIASLGPSAFVVTGWFSGRADLGGVRAEGPWGRERRDCGMDDDDSACRTEWAAHAMFVARIAK